MTEKYPPDDILQRHSKGDPSGLIEILNEIQQRHRYLSPEAIEGVADFLGLRPADVLSVASFYSGFRFKPAGRFTIKVCYGTACFVKGSEHVLEAFRSELGIPAGSDVDKEGMFSVEKVACLGCCMLAPAVQIGETIFGYVTRDRVPSVLTDFIAGLDRVKGAPPHSAGMGPVVSEIRMCTCTSCRAAGAQEIYEEIIDRVADNNAPVSVRQSGCSGVSYRAPLVEVCTGEGEVYRYGNLEPGTGADVVDKHFPKQTLLTRIRTSAAKIGDYLIHDSSQPLEAYRIDYRGSPEAPFWELQTRIVTEGYSEADPVDIDAYRRTGGFEALRKAQRNPRSALQTVVASGLRGRGGAGYASGEKWRSAAAEQSPTKYVICNADEGDPGAFMDRMILESFPFRVVEGAAIAAIAIGATDVYFYVRHEYPLAIERLTAALAMLNASGDVEHTLLPEFHIAHGAGAFVCGEETALIAAVEGKRGNPRLRPPYPAVSGLYGQPTLVNNVETLALIPWIVRNGAAEFREHGSSASPGTKTFALAGRITRGGLVEVPMGMTIREIVYEIGGGVEEGKVVKAVQIGGPSGGCLPESMFDHPVDFDSLVDAGAMMGSGGMVVLDNTDCMVSVARYFMEFTQSESCGKCAPCRVGTKRMLEILTRLCSGEGSPTDLAELEETGRSVKALSFCNLGSSAPNPVLTALKYFRSEFEAHAEGRCPAGVCRDLISYTISDRCVGCTICAQNCPVSVISGVPYAKHEIDQEYCIRCGTCMSVCPENAVEVT